MGNGVFGAEAASHYYFNTTTLSLSKNQAAAIAAILPNPRKYNANPPDSYIEERIRWIKGQMVKVGPIKFK